MEIPEWIRKIRKDLVTSPILNDRRTTYNTILGLPIDKAFELIGGGQADFDKGNNDFTAEEIVLLYCYLNQKRHLSELLFAFDLLFRGSEIKNPIVIDIGCGPFTGGLALQNTLGQCTRFSYVGIDRSKKMQALGEQVAVAAESARDHFGCDRFWATDFTNLKISDKISWRPVVVIASYLFASKTVKTEDLITELCSFISRTSRGPVLFLYTNADRESANTALPLLKDCLTKNDFVQINGGEGNISFVEFGKKINLKLKYALFNRTIRDTLKDDENK